MKLYEITNEIIELIDKLEDPDMDPTEINAQLDLMKENFNDKFDGYMKARIDLIQSIESIKNEEKRLAARRKTFSNKLSYLENFLIDAMLATDQISIKTDLFSATVRDTASSVVIDDEDEIPENFLTEEIVKKIDKKAIKKHLDNHNEEWAHIEKGKSLLCK